MDFLESLGKQISEISMYDVRSAYGQAKAMVLNLSETEKLVQEATNNEAWGASSTLMQQIAQGTFNYGQFNEIMPSIYRRFTDLDARQWRQVYKALTLLEYLVKNGSERVVDDARQHLSLIKILRNFHYIDEKGKDQGINVRNRSKELAELLQDLDRVRQERRKAKANRSKYSGISSGEPSFTTSGGGRYGGFGSESLGGGGGSEAYNGSTSGGGSSSFRDSAARQDEYDEYDAGDDDDRIKAPPRKSIAASTSKDVPPTPKSSKAPEVNLFDLDDEEQVPAAPAAPVASTSANAFAADDDFDDFVAAAPAPAPTAAPIAARPPPGYTSGPLSPASSTASSSSKPNFFDMVSSPTAAPSGPARTPLGGMTSPPLAAGAPRYGAPAAPLQPQQPARYGLTNPPISTPPIAPTSTAAAGSKSAGTGFDDLWNLAGGSAAASTAGKPAQGMSMASMAQQQRSQGGIWNGPAKSQAAQASNGFDDLLM